MNNGSNNAFAIMDYSQKVNEIVLEKLRKMNLIISGKGEEARSSKVFHVLVIEDNLADVEHIRMALKQHGINFEIIMMNTAEDAFKYINRMAPYAKLAVPDLVVLDMYVPDASAILHYIKSQKHLKWLPVIAVSENGSMNETDKILADTSLKKPFNIKDFYSAFMQANDFWFMQEKLSIAS